MSYSATALVLEPQPVRATELAGILFAEGIDCHIVAHGEAAWQSLISRRPDLIILHMQTPGLLAFYRRLRDEYLGKPPRMVAVTSPETLSPELAKLELDAVILTPLASNSMFSPLATGQKLRQQILDVGRMRELLKLSCLGQELQGSLESIAHRLVLVYGVANCAILAMASERQWVATVGERIPADAWPDLWSRCDIAVSAGAPIFVPVPQDSGPPLIETLFAVPIVAPGGAAIGAISLFADGQMTFGHESRDALCDFASRLGTELSWRSVHERMTQERDRLRETAMIDPMLGVLSRTALEQALSTEIARLERGRENLALAVFDITGLRHINDRFGHVAGDATLKYVADLIRRMSRAQDVVGRSGDDEIAVVFANTSLPAATALLDRIRKAIEAEPLKAGVDDVYITVSIGVTEFNDKDNEATLLSRAARTAAAAKQRGGSIAIADNTSPRADTKQNLSNDRYHAGVTLGGMYQIVHEISRGAMGVVYRAEDLGLSRPVALKMLRPDLVSDAELVRRFREEAAVLAAINHEHLVRVYSFVEDRDDVFFVMELVEGVSLDNVIIEHNDLGQKMPLDRSASIIEQISSALDAMHDAGVMHRDVKPGNIVLDRLRDRAVLVDVGLARKLGDKGEPAGTPGFIAPESFQNGQEGPPTDVYGLGATCYAILTGHAPFGKANDYRQILRRQVEELPTLPSSLRSELSSTVDAIFRRSLAVDPKDRFSTAGEFGDALIDALGVASSASKSKKQRNSSDTIATPQGDVPQPSYESRRTITLDIDLKTPAATRHNEPVTRGVIFRSVSQVLGVRSMTAWQHTLERNNPELADALSVRTTPLAWLPATVFFELLTAAQASGRNPQTFARELGCNVVVQSFRRFFPASPETISPSTTMTALDVLWRRYHSWGRIRASSVDELAAKVVFEESKDVATCAFVEGWLEAVIGQSGGIDSRVIHTHCRFLGDTNCEYVARWSGRLRPEE